MEIPGQGLQRLGQTILQLPQALLQFQRLREENEFQNAKLQWVKGVIAFNGGLGDDVENYETDWEVAEWFVLIVVILDLVFPYNPMPA